MRDEANTLPSPFDLDRAAEAVAASITALCDEITLCLAPFRSALEDQRVAKRQQQLAKDLTRLLDAYAAEVVTQSRASVRGPVAHCL